MLKEINRQEVAGKICSFQTREKGTQRAVIFSVTVHHGKPDAEGHQAVWFIPCYASNSAAEYIVKSGIKNGYRIHVSGVHGVPMKKEVVDGKEITKKRDFLFVNEILGYEEPKDSSYTENKEQKKEQKNEQKEENWDDIIPF